MDPEMRPVTLLLRTRDEPLVGLLLRTILSDLPGSFWRMMERFHWQVSAEELQARNEPPLCHCLVRHKAVKILKSMYRPLGSGSETKAQLMGYTEEKDVFGDTPLVRAIRDSFTQGFDVMLDSNLQESDNLDWRYLLRVADGVSFETLDFLAWSIHRHKFANISQRQFIALIREKNIREKLRKPLKIKDT